MLFFNNIYCTQRDAAAAGRAPTGLDNDDHDYHSGDSHSLVTAPARTPMRMGRPGAIPEQRE